jgi:hypothetical protein
VTGNAKTVSARVLFKYFMCYTFVIRARKQSKPTEYINNLNNNSGQLVYCTVAKLFTPTFCSILRQKRMSHIKDRFLFLIHITINTFIYSHHQTIKKNWTIFIEVRSFNLASCHRKGDKSIHSRLAQGNK